MPRRPRNRKRLEAVLLPRPDPGAPAGVARRVPGEDLRGQVGVRGRARRRESLEPRESAAARAVVAAVVAGERQQRVELRGVEYVFEVLREDARRAPRVLEPVLVQLLLRQRPKVKRLSVAPRVVEVCARLVLFFKTHARLVQRGESVQSRKIVRHARVVPRATRRRAAVRVELERGEHVQLLGARDSTLYPRRLRREPAQRVRALQVLPGALEQVHRVGVSSRLRQVRGVLGEQALDLREVVPLGERHRLIPAAQRHARVHGGFDVARARVRAHRGRAQADAHELLCHIQQQRATSGVVRAFRRFRHFLDQSLQAFEILQRVVTLRQPRNGDGPIARLAVVPDGFGPLPAVGEVVPDVAPRRVQRVVVAGVRDARDELLHAEPVPEALPEVHRQIRAVRLEKRALGVVEPREVRRHLRAPRGFALQKRQPLDELDAVVVGAAHERLVRERQVVALQRVLGEQTPQARVRARLREPKRLRRVRRLRQQTPRVTQRRRVVVDDVLPAGAGSFAVADVTGHTHDLVQGHGAHGQVAERADVRGRHHGLFRLRAAVHDHLRLFHRRERVFVVVAPTHVPRVFALERRLNRLMNRLRGVHVLRRLRGQVEDAEHPRSVDGGELRAFAVQSQDARAALGGQPAFRRQAGKTEPEHRARLSGDQQRFFRHGDGRHGVVRRAVRGNVTVTVARVAIDVERARRFVVAAAAAIPPKKHDGARRDGDVRRAHRRGQGFHLDRPRRHRGPDGVAQGQRVRSRGLAVRREHAPLAGGADQNQPLHVFRARRVESSRVPKHHRPLLAAETGLESVLTRSSAFRRVRERVPKVPPLVVGHDVGEVHEAVHRERDARPARLPAHRADPRARDAERARQRPVRFIEVRGVHVAPVRTDANARDGEVRPRGVPARVRRLLESGAHDQGRVVARAAHQLHVPVGEAQRERGRI